LVAPKGCIIKKACDRCQKSTRIGRTRAFSDQFSFRLLEEVLQPDRILTDVGPGPMGREENGNGRTVPGCDH
jgi:hypothetical protein